MRAARAGPPADHAKQRQCYAAAGSIHCSWPSGRHARTAIDLELSGEAGRQILDTPSISSQLFTTINVMLPPTLALGMSVVIVILLLTFLVTSADSAVLIINTIAAAGDSSQKKSHHIIVWGLALTLVIGVLLVAGGLSAINTAMIIGALPFSMVMALMGISLLKAVIEESGRTKQE